MSLTTSDLIFGGGYAQGARKITQGQPKIDGAIDIKDPRFGRIMREQINWLNVNEPDIPAVVSSLTAKTIGININVQVESKVSSFNAEAEELIQEFCGFEIVNNREQAICDLSGKLHFASAARVMSDFAALHGGFIVRHHFLYVWKIPYKFELVGVDMIDVSKTTWSRSGESREPTTINGIERDVYGKITHVWLYNTLDKRSSTRVPYSDITYYSEVWVNIDQQSAISKLTSILSRLDDSTQYAVAELQSAIEEAKAGHYIKSTAYNQYMSIIAEEVAKEIPSINSSADRISRAKDLVTPILRGLSNLGIKSDRLTPIPASDEVLFNTSRRASIYKDMTSNSEMKIAAASGMSDIGVYSKAADANYSSIKYTLETDQRTADIRFNDLSNRVFFGIFSRLVQVGVQMGRIKDRAAYWKNPNAFHKFRYLRHNKIDTEPAKTSAANEKNIALGLKTEGQIIEQAEGIKYETFLAKKSEQALLKLQHDIDLKLAEKEAYEKAGLTVPTSIPTQGKPNG